MEELELIECLIENEVKQDDIDYALKYFLS
jgi:hypothetical protein